MGPLALTLAMALTGTVGEPTPEELVGLLGSADKVEREEAARTLEELGEAALPVLRGVDRSAPAPVRARASDVIKAIEERSVDRPTLVAVDFDGQPLGDAVRVLAGRSGFALKLEPGDDRALALRPIRARAPAPVPFWEALDLVGRAGKVRHDPGFRDERANLSTGIPLVDGEPPAYSVYRGPFRVHLLGLHRRRDMNLSVERGRSPSPSYAFSAEVQAFVEPGRFLESGGAPEVEAVDDRGRTLPPPSVASMGPTTPEPRGWNTPGAIGVVQWRLPIGFPAEDAKALRTLRGTLPVVVSARRPGPLVISLDNPPAQPQPVEGGTLAVRVNRNGPDQFQAELTLRPEPNPEAGRPARGPDFRKPQLLFEDREGHALPWLSLFENAGHGGEQTIRVTVSGPGAPARLSYFGLLRVPVSIPFEFTDVPLP